jgi:hypothetical protein
MGMKVMMISHWPRFYLYIALSKLIERSTDNKMSLSFITLLQDETAENKADGRWL